MILPLAAMLGAPRIMTPVWLAIPAVFPALAPMKLPCTVLFDPPTIDTPALRLPEMTLRWLVAVPPMRLFAEL